LFWSFLSYYYEIHQGYGSLKTMRLEG
jgi:hypothetical protein